jgi:myo-inositol-1(or 4)-monophosphatase
MQSTHGLRRMGSAAVDLAYVACGRFEGFFEYGLHAWDVAAGILLVQEAGGTVCDFQSDNDYLFGSSIVADNTKIHEPLMACIQSHFN